jgi:osmotically-inducible protein OsmY
MDILDSRAQELHDRVNTALARHGSHDARRISVTLDGTCATLKGDVRTWAQHEAAERAALSTPGITTVDNQLCIYVEGKLDARVGQ